MRLLGLFLVGGVLGALPFLSSAEEKRMVCYYGAWAVYRPGNGKFLVEDIDPNLCTHLVYGFAILENDVIKSHDPWEDLKTGGGKGGYFRFSSLKRRNPKLKTIIAIGGWNEGSEKYSKMAADPTARKTFIDSIIPFLKEYNFDGLDLDWEYPTTRGGAPEDRENFALLVQELREALGSRYLLTAAVSPNIETVAQAYDVAVLADNLDFVSVMCYDYHGAWEGHPFTGHNTPLYRHPRDAEYIPHFNVNDTLSYYLEAGLPAEKINMGMALYGRGFTLDDPAHHGLYAPAKEGIKMGPYTRQDGTWGYNEICEVFKKESKDWRIVIDEHIKAPYAYKENMWIGYDDVESLYVKANFARDLNLGGAMVWSIETDDFKGFCHNKKYLLINTIRKTMNGGGKPSIPERPQIVSGEDEGAHVEGTTTPDYEDEVTTVPPKRTRPPRRSTTPIPGEHEESIDEDLTTTERPKRTRPPRRSTTQDPHSSEIVDIEDDTTTARPQRPRPRPTRPTTTTPPEDHVDTSEDGECHSEGVHPNGRDCHSFIICQHLGGGQYTKHVQHCAPGLAFDPVIKGCNFPNQVPNCQERASHMHTAFRKFMA